MERDEHFRKPSDSWAAYCCQLYPQEFSVPDCRRVDVEPADQGQPECPLGHLGRDDLVVAPDDTWVLRGGFFSVLSRTRNLRAVHDAYGTWGICVAAAPDSTPIEIASHRTFGNEQMQIALAGELARDANAIVVVEPGRNWPSALLTFSHEPDTEDWDAVIAVFGRREPQPNPSYQGPG
jgi:hypothetical protein